MLQQMLQQVNYWNSTIATLPINSLGLPHLRRDWLGSPRPHLRRD
jgi:hypothetical protein